MGVRHRRQSHVPPEENRRSPSARGFAGFFGNSPSCKGASRELWLTFLIKFLIYTAYSITNKTMVLWLSKDLGFSDQGPARWLAGFGRRR